MPVHYFADIHSKASKFDAPVTDICHPVVANSRYSEGPRLRNRRHHALFAGNHFAQWT